MQPPVDDMLSLAFKIAPEFKAVPLYLIDSEDLATVRPEHGCLYGYAAILPDIGARDHLVASNQWRGPGRTIVMNYRKIKEDAGGFFHRAFKDVFVHELAHSVMAIVPSVDREPSTFVRIMDSKSHAAFAAQPSSDDPVLDDHAAPFIRRALHLWQRAVWAGFNADLNYLCAGVQYDMCHARFYLEALADEPLRLRDATFAEIEKTPPPPGFTELWERDLARLKEQQK